VPRLARYLTLAALACLVDTLGAQPAASPPAAAPARKALATELDAYLWKHVLSPRFPRCVDKEHGGFHTNYARDWSPLEDRSRFIVYEARVVWTAATVARHWSVWHRAQSRPIRRSKSSQACGLWHCAHATPPCRTSAVGTPAGTSGRSGRATLVAWPPADP